MQRLYCPVKEGGVCWCCLQAFAQHKQSSWYQWHEVQWWDGLVGTATWGWGVLARLQLFLDVVFRSWRGESEGEGMEIEKRLCHIMIAAHWRSKRDGERGKKRTAIKQWVLMCGEERRRGCKLIMSMFSYLQVLFRPQACETTKGTCAINMSSVILAVGIMLPVENWSLHNCEFILGVKDGNCSHFTA